MFCAALLNVWQLIIYGIFIGIFYNYGICCTCIYVQYVRIGCVCGLYLSRFFRERYNYITEAGKMPCKGWKWPFRANVESVEDPENGDGAHWGGMPGFGGSGSGCQKSWIFLNFLLSTSYLPFGVYFLNFFCCRFWWDFGVFFGLGKCFWYICVVWMTWYLPFLRQNSPNLGLLYVR